MDARRGGQGKPPIVLHVVESFAAGVGTVVCTYAQNTPLCEHHLLYHPRPGQEALPSGWEKAFRTITRLPAGHAARILATRRAIQRVRPEVVHSHSSFGGAYARLAMAPSDSLRQVHTPHGWNFQQSGGPLRRRVFWCLEGALATRTDVIAGCSKAENAAAHWGPVRPPVLYVPNVTPHVANGSPVPSRDDRLVLAAAGRIDDTKGSDFFRDSVRALRRHGHDVHAVWIGGGDDVYTRDLAAEAIEVTGWLRHADAMKRLRSADVYFHPALWEGFPLVIVEAVSLGLPVIVRRVVSYEHSGLPLVVDTPEDFARLWPVVADPGNRPQMHALAQAVLWENDPEVQRHRLYNLYGMPDVKNS